jgi:hypothetical protein
MSRDGGGRFSRELSYIEERERGCAAFWNARVSEIVCAAGGGNGEY